MKKLLPLSLVFIVLLFAGCVSGPQQAELVKDEKIPPVKLNRGRVYFYRPSPEAVMICPTIRVNGKNLIESRAMGFAVRDYWPSDITVLVGAERDKQLYFTVGAGETRYVRLNIVTGPNAGYVWPELVDNETGKREIANCKSLE